MLWWNSGSVQEILYKFGCFETAEDIINAEAGWKWFDTSSGYGDMYTIDRTPSAPLCNKILLRMKSGSNNATHYASCPAHDVQSSMHAEQQ